MFRREIAWSTDFDQILNKNPSGSFLFFCWNLQLIMRFQHIFRQEMSISIVDYIAFINARLFSSGAGGDVSPGVLRYAENEHDNFLARFYRLLASSFDFFSFCSVTGENMSNRFSSTLSTNMTTILHEKTNLLILSIFHSICRRISRDSPKRWIQIWKTFCTKYQTNLLIYSHF